MNEHLLEVKDLEVSFDTYAGEVKAVGGVSFSVEQGEVLAIVGESGCGKSVTAQTIMKLNPMPPARIKNGSIMLDGVDIIATSEKGMENIRGSLVSMVFQDPMTSLNPTMLVGKQVSETIRKHQIITNGVARRIIGALVKNNLKLNEDQRVSAAAVLTAEKQIDSRSAESVAKRILRIAGINETPEMVSSVRSTIIRNKKVTSRDGMEHAVEFLRLVQIPNAQRRAKQYPYQFSGGMRQRAMIAMALACSPKLLIADEPTTALDVTIQAQIIDLMNNLSRETNTAFILITHDLGVVASMAQRVLVMYAGKIVESGPINKIFYEPRHPYTWGLLDSRPRLDFDRSQELNPIEGAPPDLFAPPVGCRFADRCQYSMKICHEVYPDFTQVDEGHLCACWLLHPDAPKVERRKAGDRT